MSVRTTVEWRKGETGGGGTYTFNPKPNITRSMPGQKTAVLDIPKMDGGIIQTLGLKTRMIELNGVIYVRSPNFDDLVEAKSNLEIGIGTGVGQLHVISNFGQTNSKHYYYKGILDGDIRWAEQRNMSWLDYAIVILCPDPTEYIYVP